MELGFKRVFSAERAQVLSLIETMQRKMDEPSGPQQDQRHMDCRTRPDTSKICQRKGQKVEPNRQRP